MNDAIAQGARAAARRLITPAHPQLDDDVEAALQTYQTTKASDQYTDPIALGGLIVSIATLVWTIYNDISNRSANSPDADTVSRRIRQQLDQADTHALQLQFDPAERDRIIGITVDETLNATRNPDPE
ncbi:hypothetical protein [Streptomyces phaeochromogenes]|uniref:hypothetical protein n=1 Tax=Streptomyces phaeochromogenes TaxID=1923 RepID=UPI003867A1F4|nr:hypothetical protein OHB08_01625 [Streptomyces phaeochromogenes]